MHKIYSIFSQPIFKSEPYEIKDSELHHLNQLPREKNKGGGGNQRTKTDKLLDENVMSSLKTWIMGQVKSYAFDELKINKEHTYFYMTQSWANFNTTNTSHHKHWHANSLISGVYYIDTAENGGGIVMCKSPQNTNLFHTSMRVEYDSANNIQAESYVIPVSEGKIVFFPSHLGHAVEENNSDKPRVSLAFNFWIKGTLGVEEYKLDLK